MSLTKINSFDHIKGSTTAKIELVEYGDFQCSYCRKAYYAIEELLAKLDNNIKFVFREYPLTDLHPHALHAALAAEAANEFGKFWEMHALLFENQQNLDDRSLIAYAHELGIQAEDFEKEFSNSKHIQKINSDIESGSRSHVNGTPTLFINGKIYDGNPYSATDILAYLQAVNLV